MKGELKRLAGVCAGIWLGLFQVPANGQGTPLITRPVDESASVTLRGNTHPLTRLATDTGAVNGSQPAGRLILVLKRSPQREAAMRQFLSDLQSPASGSYHQWLTPEQFGQRFGATDQDLQTIGSWLRSHGLQVVGSSKGRSAIEFTGTVGQVGEAFRTSIHSYRVHGELHHANSSDPQLPQALSPAVVGIASLNDFRPKPQSHLLGRASFSNATGKVVPEWTLPGQAGGLPFYLLTPEDFATQYQVQPVYSSGITGAGQTIGIINDSNIDISLVNAYRALFRLPYGPPAVVVDGSDPGVNFDADEAYLDVENAGAVAPNASVLLYTAGSYGLLGDGGLNFALLRAVEDNKAAVLSVSFGNCEANIGDSGNQFLNSLWEQAAAQGQTALVSSGDTGSAGCDFNGSSAASQGLAVNGLASTPWNVAVGGTDFYYNDYASGGASISAYWNATNDSRKGSLRASVPEQPWNDSVYGYNIPLYDPLTNQQQTTGSGGGGLSSCVESTQNPNFTITCTGGYPKPIWQAGPGVPADGVRDVPDVSLFAANGANGSAWPICAQTGDCVPDSTGGVAISAIGGTSASAPAMAGIMALVNQRYGRQGQANFVLYRLATQHPAAFHPIIVGSNNVPCYAGSPNCSLDANGDGLNSLQQYAAHAGYDPASGLGSVNVKELLAGWPRVGFQPTSTTLALNPQTITHGKNVVARAAVTANANGSNGVPTGSVALITTSPLASNQGIAVLSLGANGTSQGTIDSLPGGTYEVYGRYSGDGVFAPSQSQPTTLTVFPEASNLNLQFQYSGPFGGPVAVTAGSQVQFGTRLVADIQVAGISAPTGTTNGVATGTVTFADGAAVLATQTLSGQGTAEYVTQALTLGPHSLSVQYSGDPSFKRATAGPIAFTVVKSDTFAFFEFPGYISSIPAGESSIFTVAVDSTAATTSSGDVNVAPTGTVTFQMSGGVPVTVKLGNWNNDAIATTTVPGLAPGSYTMTATYSGDANYNGTSVKYSFNVVATSLLPTTTKLAIKSPADPATITPSTLVTLAATVSGPPGATVAPTGTVRIFDGYFYATAPYALAPGPGATATAAITLLPSNLASGNINQLAASFSGDGHYNSSWSAPLVVSNSIADFSIVAQNSSLAMEPGGSGRTAVNLVAQFGYDAIVSLTCRAPDGLTCSLKNSSVRVNGSSAVGVTINAFTEDGGHNCRKDPDAGSVDPKLAGDQRGCRRDARPGSYTVVVSGAAPDGVIHNAAITTVVAGDTDRGGQT